MNRFSILLVVAFVSSPLLLSGCSDPKPTSVTEDADQAAIDAYKEMEAKIQSETETEMEASGLD